MSDTDDMKRDAVLSADGKFRYSLSRSWAAEGAPLLPMCFVMHNPSTADAAVDDPTIRKCIGFAQRANCNAITVVNLYAFRATDPLLLLEASRGLTVDVVGPENELHVSNAMKHAHALVFAWGSVKGPDKPFREGLMGGLARRNNAMPLCLGTMKTGAPRHPLYVSYETALKPWQPGWR